MAMVVLLAFALATATEDVKNINSSSLKEVRMEEVVLSEENSGVLERGSDLKNKYTPPEDPSDVQQKKAIAEVGGLKDKDKDKDLELQYIPLEK